MREVLDGKGTRIEHSARRFGGPAGVDLEGGQRQAEVAGDGAGMRDVRARRGAGLLDDACEIRTRARRVRDREPVPASA
jgi:hypothetical protein